MFDEAEICEVEYRRWIISVIEENSLGSIALKLGFGFYACYPGCVRTIYKPHEKRHPSNRRVLFQPEGMNANLPSNLTVPTIGPDTKSP